MNKYVKGVKKVIFIQIDNTWSCKVTCTNFQWNKVECDINVLFTYVNVPG